MMAQWLDVSIPMHAGMAVWPGDPPFSMTPLCSMAAGDSCNTSQLSLATHTGTHMDAPRHFLPEGATLDRLDVQCLFGPALVIDLSDAERLEPRHLEGVSAPRILFKTRNSRIPPDAPFQTDFLALEPDMAHAVAARGVRLVGVDYLSVAPFRRAAETHTILLRAGVIIVEGLRLAEVPAGLCEFVVLPLPLQDADGAPCRAFVRLGEECV